MEVTDGPLKMTDGLASTQKKAGRTATLSGSGTTGQLLNFGYAALASLAGLAGAVPTPAFASVSSNRMIRV